MANEWSQRNRPRVFIAAHSTLQAPCSPGVDMMVVLGAPPLAPRSPSPHFDIYRMNILEELFRCPTDTCLHARVHAKCARQALGHEPIFVSEDVVEKAARHGRWTHRRKSRTHEVCWRARTHTHEHIRSSARSKLLSSGGSATKRRI